MRLKQIALASLIGAAMAFPAFAQPATITVPTKPSITAPAITAPAVTAPAVTAPVAAAPMTTAPTTAVAKPAKPVKPVPTNVNVNTATPAELDALPGIGKARTAAIIKGRPYKAVDEIDTKKIIPHAVFEKIKASLVV